MRKVIIGVMLVLTMELGIVGGALGITNGQPDGDGHPYVGAVLFSDGVNPDPVTFCSGALISPNVVVTAGHCTYGTAYALVTFESEAINAPPQAFILGFTETHDDFCIGCGQGRPGFDTHDVGVVSLI